MNLSATHERGIQNWRSGCALCDSARYFVALRLRFELSGDREDLDNGISASREAVAFLPRGTPIVQEWRPTSASHCRRGSTCRAAWRILMRLSRLAAKHCLLRLTDIYDILADTGDTAQAVHMATRRI